ECRADSRGTPAAANQGAGVHALRRCCPSDSQGAGRESIDMTNEKRFAGLRRLFSLPSTSRSIAREVDDEIRFHLENRVAELIERGLPPDQARERALASYGDVGASRQELTSVDRRRLSRERWTTWLEAFRQDVGFAIRVFRTQR